MIADSASSTLSSLVFAHVRTTLFESLAMAYQIGIPYTGPMFNSPRPEIKDIEEWYKSASASDLEKCGKRVARGFANWAGVSPTLVSDLEMSNFDSSTSSPLLESNHRHPSSGVKTAVYRHMGNGAIDRKEVYSKQLEEKNGKDIESKCSNPKMKFLSILLAGAKILETKCARKNNIGLEGGNLEKKAWEYDSEEDGEDEEGGGVPIGNGKSLYEELEAARSLLELLDGDPFVEDITLPEFLELLRREDRAVEETLDEESKKVWKIVRWQSRLED